MNYDPDDNLAGIVVRTRRSKSAGGNGRRSMACIFVVLLLLIVSLYAAVSIRNPKLVSAQPPYERPALEGRLLDEVEVPLRDGKHLAADVSLPRSEGPFPTILIMTPYNRKLIGASLPDPQTEPVLPDLKNFALVVADWRGLFGSKRAKRGLARATMKQHGKDGCDVVEWIAEQSWSDGKVAMWGPSATGRVQYAVAAEKPPHLVCIAPLATEQPYKYETFFHGGVLKHGYVKTLSKAYGPQLLLQLHPDKDAFWKRIERMTRRPETIDVPALLVTGWYDLNPQGVFDTFHDLIRSGGPQARNHTRLVVGPWHHISLGKRIQGDLEFPSAEGASATESTLFFDYWLRGVDRGYTQRPRVCYFVTGLNEWREAGAFPPACDEIRRLHLRADGTLTWQPHGQLEASRQFRHDPDDPSPTIGGMNAFIPADPDYTKVGAGPKDQTPILGRLDSLVYTSNVLKDDLIIEGSVQVRLFVSSDQPDTDFTVRLCDAHPDGRVVLVSDGIRRLRYRNSLEQEDLLEPGAIDDVTVTLSPTAHGFLSGHRISVVVSSSNYPRFAGNTNVAGRRGLGNRKAIATNTVHHDKRHPSAALLPLATAR